MPGKKRQIKQGYRAKYGTDSTVLSYKPMPKQQAFGVAIEKGARVVLFVGGIRSGKTYAGSYEALKQIYKYGKMPNLGWIVSPTFPMSEITKRMFEDAAGDLIIKRYKAERALLMHPHKNSQIPFRVEFKSADNPDRLRGVGLAFIWIDEGAMITREAWRILLGRVLDTKGTIFITTTPMGKNWLYDEVYQQSLTNPLYQVIKANTLENHYLDPEDVAGLRARYSKDFARQELDAEFISFEGLVYKGFDPQHHVIKPFLELPSGMEVVGGIDEGYKDPFVHLWVGKLNGKYYVLDEYYEPMRTLQSHATSIRQHRFSPVTIRRWADPSGAQERADLEQLGVPTYPARNDIKAGINLVEHLFETNRLYISQGCLNVLRELGEYHYPSKEGRNSGEDPVDCANHAMDALRYVCYSEWNHNQCNPMVLVEENGDVRVYGDPANPMSNRLEDWTRMPDRKTGFITEDDLFDGVTGISEE